ncbi:hypothetical protein FPV67DRAFT_1456799 [Lyophyllum atratum]|nr:hypothetical protein FPV67DRAFT_1456799 [Lyophyllum atratum]
MDQKGCVIVFLAGQPSIVVPYPTPGTSPSPPSTPSKWSDLVDAVAQKLVDVRIRGLRSGVLSPLEDRNRRSDYSSLACGILQGGGHKKPGNLQHTTVAEEHLIKDLPSNTNIAQIAGSLNFPESIYPGISFNLSPSTITLDHLDFHNSPHGLCPVTALGKFNPKQGGHLVLFDLKIAIEFPPGSTILLLSGLLRHGNTAIQPGEQRYSITQFCAGGLVRYVRYGFCTAQSILRDHPKTGKAIIEKLNGDRAQRKARSLHLFSTITGLVKDRHQVFMGTGIPKSERERRRACREFVATSL